MHEGCGGENTVASCLCNINQSLSWLRDQEWHAWSSPSSCMKLQVTSLNQVKMNMESIRSTPSLILLPKICLNVVSAEGHSFYSSLSALYASMIHPIVAVQTGGLNICFNFPVFFLQLLYVHGHLWIMSFQLKCVLFLTRISPHALALRDKALWANMWKIQWLCPHGSCARRTPTPSMPTGQPLPACQKLVQRTRWRGGRWRPHGGRWPSTSRQPAHPLSGRDGLSISEVGGCMHCGAWPSCPHAWAACLGPSTHQNLTACLR